MRDKGYGMGVHVPHLASPVTGEPEAAPGTGCTFREDEGNLARWKGWWDVANKEQLVSFVAITIVTIARDNDTWSESRIYFALVWLLVVWSVIILLTIQSQPLILLIISASIGGFMMFIYSGLLILVNRRSLPPSVRITGFRTATMVWSGAAARDGLGDRHLRPVGQHQGAVRPVGRGMYRFLLTVAIALVIWMVLAGLAALLGFL